MAIRARKPHVTGRGRNKAWSASIWNTFGCPFLPIHARKSPLFHEIFPLSTPFVRTPVRNHVTLVDDQDRVTGTAEKLDAHRRGLLHRAFSIFVFSPDGQCLLQRRAMGKYHSGGLWSNACCSHPAPGEAMDSALSRRMEEELGLACPLRKAFEIAYDLEVGHGLREAEYNHSYLGILSRETVFSPDPEEAEQLAWFPVAEVLTDLEQAPGRYTAWFRILFPRAVACYRAEAGMKDKS